MPRPYSADLRERALLACEEGRLSRAAIAAQFRVGATTLYRWLQVWRTEGRRAAKPHAGGVAPRLDAGALEQLRALVMEKNDATLAEYAARLAERAAVKVSAPTLCRALQKLRLDRQKKPFGPRSRTGPRSSRSAPMTSPRSANSTLRGWSSSTLDSSAVEGVTTTMTRRYARAPQGQRALGSVPFGWERLTLLGALGCEGMVASMSIEAATSTPVFLAFLEQVLVPALVARKPGATVIMDNRRAHHAPAVAPLLKAAGLQLLYLPRYSPDLSPIEPGWAKLKEQLRAKAARDLPSLEAELGPAFAAITPQDARGWFRHCGYSAQPT